MKSISVGGVEVVSLTDVEESFFRLDRLFPGVRLEEWRPYLARFPWAFGEKQRTVRGRVGAYLVRSSGCTVLVDLGIGPRTFGGRGELLEDLGRSGARPEDVDVVFLTHLHGDHTGWSLGDRGEPTFPNARYVVRAAEWGASADYVGRFLAPLERSGFLDLIGGEEPVSEEATAIPTPGHSPGHASLLVSSGGEQLLVTGDVLVHPAQATEPTWNIHFDADKGQAAYTREMLLGWVEADGITLACGHVPGSGFGRVARERNGRRYWLPYWKEDALSASFEGGARGGHAG